MFTVPNCVDALLTFINEYTDYIDGVGHKDIEEKKDFKRFQNDFVVNIKDIEAKKDIKDIDLLSPIDNRQISNISNAFHIFHILHPLRLRQSILNPKQMEDQ